MTSLIERRTAFDRAVNRVTLTLTWVEDCGLISKSAQQILYTYICTEASKVCEYANIVYLPVPDTEIISC